MKNVLNRVILLGFLVAFVSGESAWGKSAQRPAGGGAFGGGDFQKPLEVKGQTRNISMMMVNQTNKNKVKFVAERRSFREQILDTKY